MARFAFIGGIPAAGKSRLAHRIASITGAIHIDIDRWREETAKDMRFKQWMNFFFEQDEECYWQKTTCEKHWGNLVKQSETFWPTIVGNISKIMKDGTPAIFEGVNILPYLAAKDLKFRGVFLLGESLEAILERNKQNPRWGKTEALQRKEAEMFFKCERPIIKSEAEKYGFKTFSDSGEAEKELVRLM